jgi:hypothetical protein
MNNSKIANDNEQIVPKVHSTYDIKILTAQLSIIPLFNTLILSYIRFPKIHQFTKTIRLKLNRKYLYASYSVLVVT